MGDGRVRRLGEFSRTCAGTWSPYLLLECGAILTRSLQSPPTKFLKQVHLEGGSMTGVVSHAVDETVLPTAETAELGRSIDRSTDRPTDRPTDRYTNVRRLYSTHMS